MNEDAIRIRAQAVGEALVAGDVDRVIGSLSSELRRNVGEVLALLPLPARQVSVDSIERTASGYAVVLELLGETDAVRVQTRWKERDGEPTIVEVSHLSRTEREPAIEPGDADAGQIGAAGQPAALSREA